MSNFYHFAAEPIPIILPWARSAHRNNKPPGFWFTDDSEDSWDNWCRTEGFHEHKLAYRHRLTLDQPRILWVEGEASFDEFVNEYAFDPRADRWDLSINWYAVSRSYAGIGIFPYLWSRRLVYRWYNTWDCASGCIWDTTAILSMEDAECQMSA